jgi:ubiquinol-cytochrome c reductase cytochrome b subunit
MSSREGIARFKGFAAWLEERTGWPSAIAMRGGAHVPGGARWQRSFGMALTFMFLAQLASGFGLALGYAPGTTSAWESVARLEAHPLGNLLRGLHAHGADLLVLALMLHLLQTALDGAFRAPREVTWWLGIALASLCFAAAFTGSLLPWDERARAAFEVATGAAGSVPLLSFALQRVLGAGSGSANLILPRAYALHAIGLPLGIAFLVYLHAALGRRHGPVPPRWVAPELLNQRHSYWPGQALADALMSLAALGAVFLLAVLNHPLLEGPADPAASFGSPRPAWYFRPLFELFRDLPPHLLPLIALLPFLVLAVLALLPLTSRLKPTTLTLRAPGWLVAAMVGIATILGATSLVRDLRNPAMRQERSLAAARAQLAQKLAMNGIGSSGILARLQDEPAARGARIFERQCLACHRVGDRGTQFGPGLSDYLSRSWLRGLVRNAGAADYYGPSGIHGMEAQDLDEESLGLIVELLYQLRGQASGESALPPVLEGSRRIFESARCSQCHALEPGKTSLGPALAGYGSAAWLTGLLHDPSRPAYFGAQNQMVISGGELTDSQRADLVAYLQTLETR